jgi:medium-chain acyl-[acyl-carrier-protein] hydrolase
MAFELPIGNSYPMSSWIVYSQPRPSANLRLFSFSHAGGGSAAFRGWADRLGDEIELGYVQLPGRESRLREKPFVSMAELIPRLVDAITAHLDRAYAFYGHSLGAKIAFEVVRELRRRGANWPAHLFVAACPAPQVPWPHPLTHCLDTPQFLDETQRRYGGIPQQVIDDKELCALLLPALRADVTMIETYTYTAEAPLDGGITVFGGLKDRMVEESSLASWRAQTRGGFRLQMACGDHFFPLLPEARLPESIAAELLDVARTHKHA